jgi:hypothetical protein
VHGDIIRRIGRERAQTRRTLNLHVIYEIFEGD